MKAIVVYESLWGNTAAIARAIAQGLGADAHALSTGEVTAEALAQADLIVAGAPGHSMGLPSAPTRQWARSGGAGGRGFSSAAIGGGRQRMARSVKERPSGRGNGGPSLPGGWSRPPGWFD